MTGSGSYASPACFAHELQADQSAGGAAAMPDPVQALDVARWRRAERGRLLAARAALSPAARAAAAAAVAGHLDDLLGDPRGLVISGWWPIRSELDLRPWLAGLAVRGAFAALPVVVERAAPLRFRLWQAQTRMQRGAWNIPVPASGDWVTPAIVLAPLLGHDDAGFRLGYGGGYFDRTLAELGAQVRAIGVGLASARIATIFAQPHDIAMQAIVTEAGVSTSCHRNEGESP